MNAQQKDDQLQIEQSDERNDGIRQRRPVDENADSLRQEIDSMLDSSNNMLRDEKLSFGWRDILDSLNQAMDALFGYNLRNVLKVINVVMILIIGVNTMSLHYELVNSNYQLTLIPSLIIGFIVLSCIFVFLLNV